MSRTQLVMMWVAVGTAFLVGLYPPWIEHVDLPSNVHVEKPAGYGWVFAPPGLSITVIPAQPAREYKAGDIVGPDDLMSPQSGAGSGRGKPQSEAPNTLPADFDRWDKPKNSSELASPAPESHSSPAILTRTTREQSPVRIDWSRLALEWLLVAIIARAMAFTLRRRKTSESQRT
jgi:hypothetical protein